jgi:hypothetical protein
VQAGGAGKEDREGFFFVKKKQKTFIRWGMGVFTCAVPIEQKFFCFFFYNTPLR